MTTSELKEILKSDEFVIEMENLLEGVRDGHGIDSGWYGYEWVNDSFSVKEDLYLEESGCTIRVEGIAEVCKYTLDFDYCTLLKAYDEDGNEIECNDDLRDYAEGFYVSLN